MPHRNELEAALARVEALQRELAELQQARAEQGAAERNVKALKGELAAARRMIEAMRPPVAAGLPDAYAHNLGFAPENGGRPGLKVACPRCLTAGVERELFQGVVSNSQGTLATCPACGHVMFVRTA